MKKILTITLTIFLISCSNNNTEGVYSHDDQQGKGKVKLKDYGYMNRPSDIPDTLYDGTPVYWDGIWQSSYINGRVTVKRDSIGRAISVSREIYKD